MHSMFVKTLMSKSMNPAQLIQTLRKSSLSFTLIAAPFAVSAADATTAAAPISAPPPPSIFSGDFGVTTANQYNTRGIIVQNDGVTFQPYLDLNAKVFEGDGFINKISLQLNLWSDVSTNKDVSAATSGNKHFTEFDYAFGFNVQFAKRFSLTSVWNRYLSPADGYKDGQFINSTLSYDDSGLLAENFSLQPHFTFLYELPDDGQAGLRAKAWYFEPGISPNTTLFKKSQAPVNAAFVIKAGLGNKFYAGNTVGYVAFGPQFTASLNFIAPQYGKWTASAGYLYYYLGDNLAAIAPGGDHSQNLFTFSTGVSF